MGIFFSDFIICRINTIQDGKFKQLDEVLVRTNEAILEFLNRISVNKKVLHRIRIKHNVRNDRLALISVIEVQTKPNTKISDIPYYSNASIGYFQSFAQEKLERFISE